MSGLVSRVINDIVKDVTEASNLWPDQYVNRQTGRVFYFQSEEVKGFVYDDKPRYLLVTAPEGSGKTALGVIKTLEGIKSGLDTIVVASSLPALRRSTWKEMALWIPPATVVPEHRHVLNPTWSPYKNFEIVFRNKYGGYTRMVVGGLGQNPIFWEGINASRCYYDEARSSAPDDDSAFGVLAGRIRIIGPEGQLPQLFITSTPTRKNHWLYRFFGPTLENDDYAEFKGHSKTIHLRLESKTSAVDDDYAQVRGLVLNENEKRMKVEGLWGETGDDQSFLEDISMWDSLFDPKLKPVRPLSDPERGWSDALVGALDAGVKKDTFGCVFVSRRPSNRKQLAVRIVRVWKPGPNGVDFNAVESFIREICQQYNVVSICYDPYQLYHLTSILRKEGLTWFQEFNQNTKRLLSDQNLYDLIFQKEIYHMNQPELREHLLNAGALIDDLERKRRIVKLYNQTSKKIDAAVALSMGSFEAMRLNL